MSQLSQLSPSSLKKQKSQSTSNLSRSKPYAPSRFNQQLKLQKSGLHDVLISIQSQIRQDSAQNQASPQLSPGQKAKQKISLQQVVNKELLKRQQSSNFKIKPLKRQDSDMAQFKEIFLNPRVENLKIIQKKTENIKTISKQYEKLLKFEKGEVTKTEESQKLSQYNVRQTYDQAIQLLQSEQNNGNFKKSSTSFYDTQIVVELPISNDTATIISGTKTLQNPSLPPSYKGVKDLKIKQLLLRAKAGMNSQDIQKQAHLSFYLGQIYTQKRRFKQALKFFKRFLGFAKMMQDRIGMAIGANRVAISYYYCQDYQKSISFHNQNLKLSDHQNCFIGFYNIGICYRKIGNAQQALQYFDSALNWAQQKGQPQSQCIALGQIAATYQYIQLYQEAVEKFEQSLAICEKLKKKQLKLDNLWYILKISSTLKIKPLQELKKITQEAFTCAKELGQIQTLDTLRCNIGILQGGQLFQKQNNTEQEQLQIQQIIQ